MIMIVWPLPGPPYLCSTRQWLDKGWIGGGYSPDKVLVYLAFIHRISVQYLHFTNAYGLSPRHLSIPILYPPVICACSPDVYDWHLYLQFIQRMTTVDGWCITKGVGRFSQFHPRRRTHDSILGSPFQQRRRIGIRTATPLCITLDNHTLSMVYLGNNMTLSWTTISIVYLYFIQT